MDIAIIGNPITTVSSGKFLQKYCEMISPSIQNIYILNDGEIAFKNMNVHVIPVTHFSKKVKEHEPNSSLIAFLSFMANQILLALGLCSCIKKIDFVIIFPITMFLPVLLAKIMGKKLILYEAQDVIWEKTNKDIRSIIKFFILSSTRWVVLELSDYITVEGRNVIKQNVIERYSDKIYICPQYVDTNKYYIKKEMKDRNKIIGFIATIDDRKGALEFALAVRKLSQTHKDLKFNIIGDGPLYNDINRLLADQIASNVVILMKHIPEDSFPDHLNELILYVLPTISEGLPNIILESMACGTPVLATPVGAIPDVISNQETGFIMENNSPECIVKNINKILNYSSIELIIDNAQKFIKNEMAYDKAVNRWRNIFLGR